eukprot:4278938-Pyramimonas_sp.AAC.1
MGSRLMVFYECVQYDETQQRARRKELEGCAAVSHHGAIIPTADSAMVQVEQKSNTLMKVLQTNRRYAMMIRHTHSYVLISFDIACWLQSMQRGTGECYHECLTESHCKHMDEISKRFERTQRLPMTDGDGAVEKAE